jgi:hypothetical protein
LFSYASACLIYAYRSSLECCSPDDAKLLRLLFAPTADDLRPYPELHPSLCWGAIGVFLHSEILLGKAVDPGAGTLLFTNDLDYAAQPKVAVWVFRVKDTECDGTPAAQNVGFGPSFRCV